MTAEMREASCVSAVECSFWARRLTIVTTSNSLRSVVVHKPVPRNSWNNEHLDPGSRSLRSKRLGRVRQHLQLVRKCLRGPPLMRGHCAQLPLLAASDTCTAIKLFSASFRSPYFSLPRMWRTSSCPPPPPCREPCCPAPTGPQETA